MSKYERIFLHCMTNAFQRPNIRILIYPNLRFILNQTEKYTEAPLEKLFKKI